MKIEKETVDFSPGLPQQGPKTAESYVERSRRREMLDDTKGKGPPLGGAPPIPPGKFQALVAGDMPTPSFEGPDGPPHIPGVGSAYAVNQAMARGEIEEPISMAEAKKKGLGGSGKSFMSDESVEALQATKTAMESGAKAQMEEAERDIVEQGKIDSSLSTPLDFDAILRAQNPLMNDDRRKVIENRLDDMHLDDMIVNREIQQLITIVPNRFELVLRTFSQREYIWVLGYLYEFPGSQAHNEQLLNTFKLVLSVVSINGKMLPDHRKNIGDMKEDVDRDLFQRKLHLVASFPVQMVADIGVQCNWFNDRVNQLLTYENVKNG